MSKYDLQPVNPQSEFLENAWYVGAQSSAVEASLQAIRLLGENLVMYRDSRGQVVVLEDACPHRKLPLSMGKLQGDILQCGYHGLCFDQKGQCVKAPTQSKIPSNAYVRSYPAVEKYGLIWLWMGDPEKANPDTILQIADYGDGDWDLTDGGVIECHCHYLYLLDNLLDPSHVAWVHETSFASDGTDDVPLIIEDTDSGVLVSRWIKDIEPPPYYADMLPFSGRVDRQQYYEAVFPSLAINMSTYTRAGEGGNLQNLPNDTYRMRSYHFITPIDTYSTRYHWFQHYNTGVGDAEVRRFLNDGARAAFEEDRVVLEAVDAGMRDPQRPSLDLQLDIGARKFRKKLTRLIDEEKAAVTGQADS